MKTEILPVTETSLRLAGEIVRSGGLVAFGTETVYGLGADARNPAAVLDVFRAKGRPSDNPLIVHLARVSEMPTVCDVPDDILNRLRTVLPAPLTVIFPKKPEIPYEVTAGLDTVAVRVPSSEGARRFIEACGVPIAAPSANTSTRPSPTTARHVYDDLNGKIPLILDTGPCEVGVESTVVDLSNGLPARVLRLGGMTVERLEEIFGEVVVPKIAPTDKPLSPGMKYRHYAPSIPVRLFDCGDFDGARSYLLEAKRRGERTVVLAIDEVLAFFSEECRSSLGEDAESAARLLFDRLRALEKEYDSILTFRFPESGMGRAVNNRLTKASSGK